MALTRKLLKGMGLTDEQVDTIIEAHTDTTDGLKADLVKAKADAEKLPGIQKELEDLKAKGDDGWKDKHDKVKKEFDDFKADITAKETRGAKEKAYRDLLKTIGINEKYIDDVMGVAKLEDLKLTDGKFDGEADLTKTIKEKFGAFVTQTQTVGATVNNPPTNNGGSGKTKEDILAIRDGAARRKAMLDNPQLFGLTPESK